MKLLNRFGFLLPILGAAYTVLSLWSINSNRTSLLDLLLPLGLAILLSIVSWGIVHILPALGKSSLPSTMRDNVNIFAAIVSVVILLWGIFPNPYIPPEILAVTSLFCMFFSFKKAVPALIMFLLVLNLVAIGQGTLATAKTPVVKAATVNTESDTISMNDDVNSTATALPDIYFIIPDRMPSIAAELEDGFTGATAFQQSLENLGFQVWPDSLSSDPLKNTQTTGTATTRTQRFVASALNYGEPVTINLSYKAAMDMIQYPKVAADLKANGYKYYEIGSWWPVTATSPSADYNFPFHVSTLADAVNSSFASTAFSRTLLGWTGMSLTGIVRDTYTVEAARQAYQIQTIEDIATGEIEQAQNTSPKFTFMHLLLPHPPYIWTADGQQRNPATPDKQAYLDQIEYASTQITKLATNLRAEDPTAIIIIEADEGMAYPDPQDRELNQAEDNTEWNGTLSAWYVPFNTVGISITQILGDAASYAESLNK
jgi:hypothetical protein